MVDNWDEILDAPANASIVRSKGNWLGRLAAMSLCLQLGRPNIVLPNRFCWECVVDAWRHMKPQHAKQRKQTADLSVVPEAGNASRMTGVYENIGNATWDHVKGEWIFHTTEVGSSERTSTEVESITEGLLPKDALEEMTDLVVIC